MDRYIIVGGHRLEGDVRVDGSKNSVLPVLAATIINGKESVIHNVPELKDVDSLIGLLRTIGCKCLFENNTLIVKSNNSLDTLIPEKPVREMRSSIILMGAMLARNGKVKISYRNRAKAYRHSFVRFKKDGNQDYRSPWVYKLRVRQTERRRDKP